MLRHSDVDEAGRDPRRVKDQWASVVRAKERCGSPTSRDPLPANRHQQWTHCSTNEIPVVAMEGSQLEWTDTAIMGMSGIKNGGLSHHCTLEVSIRSTACLTTSVRRSVKYQLQWRGYLEQRMQYRRIRCAYRFAHRRRLRESLLVPCCAKETSEPQHVQISSQTFNALLARAQL